MMESKKPNIEVILTYIGITPDSVRHDAYNHWYRFLDFCKQNSGKEWKNDIRAKLRSWIGVDFRYIDDYLESCLSWGIIELNDGILVFRGLHNNTEIPEPSKENEELNEKLRQHGLTDEQRKTIDEKMDWTAFNERSIRVGQTPVSFKKWKSLGSPKAKMGG